MKIWTAESISKLPKDKVTSLRENAERLGENEIVEWCIAEISSRAPKRSKSARPRKPHDSRHGKKVVGFHFVCPRETGVTTNDDGTVWTGTWVVDKNHAEKASKIDGYVALHAAKSEPSYLQGIIRDWRKTKRENEYAEGRPVRIEFGVDFLLQPTPVSYEWKGDGTGEKGYVWEKA